MRMRLVRLVWTSDEGTEVEVQGDLNEAAIVDLMNVIEIIDGDEEYEQGMILDLRELRP